MIAYWGDYAFDNHEIQFGQAVQRVKGKSNRRMYDAYRFTVRGVKQAANAAALTTALQELEAALAVDDLSFTFKDDSNNNTVHVIDKDQTINGTRITNFRYTAGFPGVWGARAEYVNRRTYEFTIEAEIPNVESNLVFWTQTVAVLQPGTTDFVIQESLSGAPVYQQTCAYTKEVFEQFGFAIGYQSYPAYPEAYWLDYLKPYPFLQAASDPIEWGIHTNTMYPIRWRYRFEAPGDITAQNPIKPTF